MSTRNFFLTFCSGLLVILLVACRTGPSNASSPEKQTVDRSNRSKNSMKMLFNGKNLEGWEPVGGSAESWKVEDGILYTEGEGVDWEKGHGGGWLSTTRKYSNFVLILEFKVSEAGNSGVFLRAPRDGDPAFQGLEVQLLDDYADKFQDLDPAQYTGSVYELAAPSSRVSKQPGVWQKMKIVCDGPVVRVHLNGEQVVDLNLNDVQEQADKHPGVNRSSGYIGLQNHNTKVSFRSIWIQEL